jgi:hypothetical protein
MNRFGAAISAAPANQEAAMADDPTTTQPAPNISTEHQDKGDARKPSDTLDKAQDERTDHTKTQPSPNISTEN